MGKIFFIAIALIFTLQVILKPGIKKLLWFFAGVLLFPPAVTIISSPSVPFPRLMIYVLLTVTFIQQKKVFSELKLFVLKVPLLILFFLLLCIGLSDSRLNLFLQFYRPITYFLENFFIVFLTYYYIKSSNDALRIYDFLIKIFILFGLYGLSNYVTKNNEYNAFITNLYNSHDFANDNMITGLYRFRVSSLSWHAIYYGFLLMIMLLMETFMFTSVKIRQKNYVIYIFVAILLLVNLFLANSRTPILGLIAGALIYVLFAIKLTKKIAIFYAVIFAGIVSFAVLPKSAEIVLKTANIFTGRDAEKKGEGSSMKMRQMQLDASVRIFNQSPVTGNGFEYINENLGYSSDTKKSKSSKDLEGFESYYFKLLIEQGMLGIAGNLILFIVLIIWLIKKYFKVSQFGKKIIVFTISITIAFIIFIIGTGDLGSFLFFMSILGINIKLIELNDQRRVIYMYH
ncbi:O-antigen ligase-like membrane protein [Mucilaginibacter yixingensis]|uniref:O-antigen ligase-like membrane protein n=1 Tax=Mucilaginibacter yixingensis TaxID=1295612 RepID=A0A2T5JC44_9SPHI|nr:O-antigen ligase family protein [Mucilaginibacter yixingensis]PTQ99330.1 O-antigen ligase-like membrane protein [Mucilaginibacter yixingensis]